MSTSYHTSTDVHCIWNRIVDWEIAWADARDRLLTPGDLITAAWELRNARAAYVAVVGSTNGIHESKGTGHE